MRLVIDSSAAIRASSSAGAAADLRGHELIGPPILWSEVHSAVHEALWRKQVSSTGAEALLVAFAGLGIERRAPTRLHGESYRIATELGWAKTYDAEFVALARLTTSKVLTTDARLRRGADRTGLVMDPSEL